MKMLQQIKKENAGLRAALESKTPGCTSTVAVASVRDGTSEPSLDELFAEQAQLHAVSDGLEAQIRVEQRGTVVAAKYGGKKSSATERVQAAKGCKSIAELNAKHQRVGLPR
ncbi:MAG: hypothetical protein RLZZ350_882 [Verrucomicrobiota bacterium]|jgi:hypothetical protein